MTDTIVIIGYGRMGGAFASAWSETHRVLVHDPLIAAVRRGCDVLADASSIPAGATVLLAVKPQLLGEAAAALAPVLPIDATLLSIMAA